MINSSILFLTTLCILFNSPVFSVQGYDLNDIPKMQISIVGHRFLSSGSSTPQLLRFYIPQTRGTKRCGTNCRIIIAKLLAMLDAPINRSIVYKHSIIPLLQDHGRKRLSRRNIWAG